MTQKSKDDDNQNRGDDGDWLQRSNVLAGYVTREALAKQLDKSERTLARWEMIRIGPPVTHLGREPVYRIEAVRDWLKSKERPMVRERRKAVA